MTPAHGAAGATLLAGMLPAAQATQPSSPATHAVGYPTLFLLVALGSVVLVVPTSVVVTAAAAVAWHADTWYSLPLVLLVATTAALCGDTVLYSLARRGGERWLVRLREQVDTPRLQNAQRQLSEHGAAVLVIGRLLPAGKVPVMVACLVSRWRIRQFVRADVLAALAWAGCYSTIGALGGSLFAEPWQGVVAAIALALVITATPLAWRRLRRPASVADPQPASRD